MGGRGLAQLFCWLFRWLFRWLFDCWLLPNVVELDCEVYPLVLEVAADLCSMGLDLVEVRLIVIVVHPNLEPALKLVFQGGVDNAHPVDALAQARDASDGQEHQALINFEDVLFGHFLWETEVVVAALGIGWVLPAGRDSLPEEVDGLHFLELPADFVPSYQGWLTRSTCRRGGR